MEYFLTYKGGYYGTVKMRNESVSQIAGIGDIYIQTSIGCTLKLKDVRHIPDLRLNLIYVHILYKDGYCHFINNGNWKLCNALKIPHNFFLYNFTIYSWYKLSQLGYFPGIVK